MLAYRVVCKYNNSKDEKNGYNRVAVSVFDISIWFLLMLVEITFDGAFRRFLEFFAVQFQSCNL